MTNDTVNIRPLLAKAYEEGRAAGILEAINRAQILENLLNMNQGLRIPTPKIFTGIKVVAKGHKITKNTPTDAKKAPIVRTKGVKEAILALIASGSMSPAAIIAATGFKGTSVRATLMGLKKSGLAISDEGQWVAIHHDGHGNSEAEAHLS